MANKRISQTLSNENQSWNYESIHNFMGKKVRIYIRRNAYDIQSFLSAEIFDKKENKWNRLCSIPFKGAACTPVVYVQNHVDIKLFEADEARLLTKAALILD